MTLLPVDSWNVKARPDLPAYEMNTENADPFSSAPATENHHLWRRSFGKDFRECWWVELEDGTIVPNRVGLSQKSHQLVTENKVRIEYNPADGRFYWRELVPGFLAEPLNPQPGPPMQLTIDGGEVPHSHVVNSAEEKCPSCKGTGKKAKKPKDEHEPAAPRPKAVLSIRVPKKVVEGGEDGVSVLTTLIESCREKLAGELGWSLDGDASYYTLAAVMHDWLTNA